jgi:hypothetical protein
LIIFNFPFVTMVHSKHLPSGFRCIRLFMFKGISYYSHRLRRVLGTSAPAVPSSPQYELRERSKEKEVSDDGYT